MENKYEVAAYYFPGYHQDKRIDNWHGKGWSEWELVKRSESRFEGHQQPKVPAWGYEDEADPIVMAKKINAAADYGVTCFIFDWYWHEEGPMLQRALEEGFLNARNDDRLKFSLMWANHNWSDIHPATRDGSHATLADGCVSEETFVKATDHVIDKYFSHPSYWKVNDGLYFSIYELMSLVEGLGGIDNTKRVLRNFRDRVRKSAVGELHLNAVVWGIKILPGEKKITNPNEMIKELGFDSVTSYVWIHHQELKEFPKTAYSQISEASMKDSYKFAQTYDVPCYPNVTMGWDSSPRTIQSDVFDNLGYPYMPILDGNTPEEFEKALIGAKDFMDKSLTNPKIVTVNAWNEWTEGSYLEPDMINGMAYLEAIRKVFGE